ncbi:MAG: CvpA family protein [Eubacterium sp.]
MTIFNYTVNYIDIALAAIFLIFTFAGYKRGLFITLINFVRYALGFSLCFYLSDNLTQPVYDNFIRERMLEMINQKIATSANIDEILANLQNFASSLPDFISNGLSVESLSISNEEIAQSLLTNVFEPIILAVTKGAVFAAVFIVFFLSTGLIIHFIRKSSRRRDEKKGRKSTLKKTDKLFGALFGALKSFIVILAITSILMFVLEVSENMAESNAFLTEVSNSRLLERIDTINPFNAITEGLI